MTDNPQDRPVPMVTLIGWLLSVFLMVDSAVHGPKVVAVFWAFVAACALMLHRREVGKFRKWLRQHGDR